MDNIKLLEDLLLNYKPNLQKVNPATVFEDMGMDSYSVVDFIMRVEEEFGIIISDDQLLSIGSLCDLQKALNKCNEEEKHA